MRALCAEYKELIRRYLLGGISSSEFCDVYIHKFKGERRVIDEDLFLLLDELFGDVDMYTEDEDLYVRGGEYLNGKDLRAKAEDIFFRLPC
ncbi:colicin immunity domain-containing protein [Metapseudomonas otitidis]|jgi:hypothetical protein|uniref:colicin immunity domain-containing protein n=1 Tax=Metapseudomonas otitidis TaxID=319939 RepID=UPI001CA425B6|nr:colicin immunity domain-containing protein [Pseudomonas otitidis]QZX80760.1 hypothetical protein K6751_15775 [Pseudomonas otitidis]